MLVGVAEVLLALQVRVQLRKSSCKCLQVFLFIDIPVCRHLPSSIAKTLADRDNKPSCCTAQQSLDTDRFRGF
jgi:hypothetical protein